jgi:hypothetical protein
MRWFNDGKLNGLHPKLFARPSVEAVQVSLLARVFRTSDKDAPMRNDGAAVTRTWECRLPADVIRRSPMERRFVLLSDTIPKRPAELRPIPCPHYQSGTTARQAQQQQQREIPAHARLGVGDDLGGGPSERKSGDGEWLLDPAGSRGRCQRLEPEPACSHRFKNCLNRCGSEPRGLRRNPFR